MCSHTHNHIVTHDVLVFSVLIFILFFFVAFVRCIFSNIVNRMVRTEKRRKWHGDGDGEMETEKYGRHTWRQMFWKFQMKNFIFVLLFNSFHYIPTVKSIYSISVSFPNEKSNRDWWEMMSVQRWWKRIWCELEDGWSGEWRWRWTDGR